MRRKQAPLRGVIQPRAVPRPFEVARWEAPAGLGDFIEHIWRVRWSVSEPFVQFTLPDPVAHLVFENGDVSVHMPMSTRFRRELVGEGEVLGFKFRPGAFRGLSPTSMKLWLDAKVPGAELFGDEVRRLARSLPDMSELSRIEAIAEWLRGQLSAPLEPDRRQLADLVERMIGDRSIQRVSPLARELGISERTLQRRFEDVVGWTPNQVIRRRRVHDALARLDQDEPPDLASLAFELGYCDQAHFSRDFKRMTAMTPSAYLGC